MLRLAENVLVWSLAMRHLVIFAIQKNVYVVRCKTSDCKEDHEHHQIRDWLKTPIESSQCFVNKTNGNVTGVTRDLYLGPVSRCIPPPHYEQGERANLAQ